MTMTETAISLSQTAKAQTPLRVTIRNVAELAGVSTATVSNVITIPAA